MRVDSKPDAGDFINKSVKWDLLKAVGAHEPIFHFDLQKVKHLKPYSIACLTALALNCRQPPTIALPEERKCCEHLARMKFFDFFNYNETIAAGQRQSNLPVRHFCMDEHIDDFHVEAAELWDRQIEGMSPDTRRHIADQLWEIIMNALTHSQSPIGCVVCGQAFAESRKVEVAVLDMGQTILGHLKQNPTYQHLMTHEEAIVLATEEGVTGTVGRNRFNEVNSGSGLACMRELCADGIAELAIISGDNISIFDKPHRHVSHPMSTPFHGCLVNIKFFC